MSIERTRMPKLKYRRENLHLCIGNSMKIKRTRIDALWGLPAVNDEDEVVITRGIQLRQRGTVLRRMNGLVRSLYELIFLFLLTRGIIIT